MGHQGKQTPSVLNSSKFHFVFRIIKKYFISKLSHFISFSSIKIFLLLKKYSNNLFPFFYIKKLKSYFNTHFKNKTNHKIQKNLKTFKFQKKLCLYCKFCRKNAYRRKNLSFFSSGFTYFPGWHVPLDVPLIPREPIIKPKIIIKMSPVNPDVEK